MKNIYPVTIKYGATEKTYSPEFQTDEQYQKSWKTVLQKAHGTAEVVCQCGQSIGRRLAVRHYDDNDSFGLARFPMTGTQHASDCQYYSTALFTHDTDTETIGVIDGQEDGTVKVRLGIGLRKKDDPIEKAPKPTKPSSPGGRRQSPIRLLGLLQFLWVEAGLNRWWPAMAGKRDSNLVHWLLQSAASQVKVGRIALDDILLLSARHPDSKVAIANRTKVANAAVENLRLLVIAPLAKFIAERDVQGVDSLRVVGFHGMPFLRISTELWELSHKRYSRALSAWRVGSTVMVIAQIELPANSTSRANVVDLGLMHVTDAWIPVDSSYEEKLARKLVLEGRAFDKPLRFDQNVSDDHPDFVLIDTDPETALEVFGRDDEKYTERKAEKFKLHADDENWWYWDAAADPSGDSMRPLPNKKNR